MVLRIQVVLHNGNKEKQLRKELKEEKKSSAVFGLISLKIVYLVYNYTVE